MREETKQKLRRLLGMQEKTVLDAVIIPDYMRGEPEKNSRTSQPANTDIYTMPLVKPRKNPKETGYRPQRTNGVDIF